MLGLLTDYGPHTEHVGALHAVAATIAPQVGRVDLAHDVPAGDIRWGAVLLEAAREQHHLACAITDAMRE